MKACLFTNQMFCIENYSTISLPFFVSSPLMKPGLAMCDSIALNIMHMPGIFLSLFVSWLCVGSQSVVYSCGSGLYSILCCVVVFLVVFFETCMLGLQHDS